MAKQNIGRFVWFDLMVPEAGAAKEFYGNLMGWTTKPFGDGSMGYEMWQVGDAAIGGVMAFTDEMKQRGVPSHWLGYVKVDDVDATLKQAAELGGHTMKPADDIPGGGRFAILTDPQGAAIGIFSSSEDGEALPDDTPVGHFGWSELATDDWEKGWAFYQRLFGWVKSDSMDMPDGAGTYFMYKVAGMKNSMGGMFTRPKEMPVSAWLYYAEVDNLDAAVEKVKQGGGNIVNGPMDVPGGSRIAQCVDPQGAMFALHSK